MTDHAHAAQHHQHQHGSAHGTDAPSYDRAWWDQRYADHDAVWSGRPNPQLVAEASDLSPGRALDVGCGEGADTIWLAGRGWQVTGLDFSQVGLDRAASLARAVGDEVATRIRWERQDLLAWTPPVRAYDLVSAQFMHLPRAQMLTLVEQLAGAVADEGTLLVVGHDFSDVTTGRRPDRPELFYTVAELAGLLSGDWVIEVAENRQRQVAGADGAPVTHTDAVLRARRSRATA